MASARVSIGISNIRCPICSVACAPRFIGRTGRRAACARRLTSTSPIAGSAGSVEGSVPDHSTFSKNRHGRFRDSDLLRELFEATVRRKQSGRTSTPLVQGVVGGIDVATEARPSSQSCRAGAKKSISTVSTHTNSCGPLGGIMRTVTPDHARADREHD